MINYLDKSNNVLFEEVKSSNHKAFKVLYDRLWDKMYIKAYSILRDKHKAKDIIQEVWIDVWERRQEIENTNIEGYLMTASKFKIYNEFRNSKHKNVLLSEFLDYLDLNKFDVDPTGRNLEFEETKDNLDKLISNLPYKCQSVFKLSRYEDLKNKEIADQLNISQRTVETHISNALKILKRNISLPIVFLVSFFC